MNNATVRSKNPPNPFKSTISSKPAARTADQSKPTDTPASPAATASQLEQTPSDQKLLQTNTVLATKTMFQTAQLKQQAPTPGASNTGQQPGINARTLDTNPAGTASPTSAEDDPVTTLKNPEITTNFNTDGSVTEPDGTIQLPSGLRLSSSEGTIETLSGDVVGRMNPDGNFQLANGLTLLPDRHVVNSNGEDMGVFDENNGDPIVRLSAGGGNIQTDIVSGAVTDPSGQVFGAMNTDGRGIYNITTEGAAKGFSVMPDGTVRTTTGNLTDATMALGPGGKANMVQLGDTTIINLDGTAYAPDNLDFSIGTIDTSGNIKLIDGNLKSPTGEVQDIYGNQLGQMQPDGTIKMVNNIGIKLLDEAGTIMSADGSTPIGALKPAPNNFSGYLIQLKNGAVMSEDGQVVDQLSGFSFGKIQPDGRTALTGDNAGKFLLPDENGTVVDAEGVIVGNINPGQTVITPSEPIPGSVDPEANPNAAPEAQIDSAAGSEAESPEQMAANNEDLAANIRASLEQIPGLSQQQIDEAVNEGVQAASENEGSSSAGLQDIANVARAEDGAAGVAWVAANSDKIARGIRGFSKALGAVGIVVTGAMSVYKLSKLGYHFMKGEEDKVHSDLQDLGAFAVTTGGALAGAAGGAQVGAYIGAFGGPVGAALGGLIGGVVGGVLGGWGSDKLWHWWKKN